MKEIYRSDDYINYRRKILERRDILEMTNDLSDI